MKWNILVFDTQYIIVILFYNSPALNMKVPLDNKNTRLHWQIIYYTSC